MAYSDHRKVEITKNDLIIISATPIPGNEKAVSNVINELFKIGAEVIYKSLMDVHVSGHACQEELKTILALTKPKYFIPVHGEHRHLMLHAKLAESIGIKNTFILENGSVLEIDNEKAKKTGTVTAGKILVDGLGVGDVGNVVLRDRKLLAQDGLIIAVVPVSRKTGELLTEPEIISRGFVYVRESEELMENIRRAAREGVEKCPKQRTIEYSVMKNSVKSCISRYIYETTRRSPMILPIIVDI
jgi:ribonuclease J